MILANGDITFNPDSDFEHLNYGQATSTSVTYTVDDGTGLQDSATLTVEVSGVNDSPTTFDSIAPQSNSSGSTIVPLDVSGFFTDVDDLTLTFDDGGSLPSGLSIDPVTGVIRGTVVPGSSELGVHQVAITATDSDGAEINQVFEWVITKTVPVAADDFASTDEDSSVSVPALTGLLSNDIDLDGDLLTVQLVNGTPIVSGAQIGLPSGAQLIVNEDGSFEYDPNGKFDGLITGQSAADTFTYTVEDQDGNQSTAVVYVSVAGVDDAPNAVDDSAETKGVLEVNASDGLLSNDFDADSNSNLTVVEMNGEAVVGTSTTLPSGGVVTVNPDGSYLYDSTNTISSEGTPTFTDSFNYTIVDDQGKTSTATVTITIGSDFAFDSFTNQSIQIQDHVRPDSGDAVQDDNRTVAPQMPQSPTRISTQIDTFVPEPVLAGYAPPGSVLVARIYDQFGSLLGKSQAVASEAGNWVMNFYGIEGQPSMRVVIDVVDQQNADDVGIGHFFRLTASTYRALQLGTEYRPNVTAQSILSDTPANWIGESHQQNMNPLGLL